MTNLIIFSIAFIVNSVLLADCILKAVQSKAPIETFRNSILFDVFFLALSVAGLFYSIFEAVSK